MKTAQRELTWDLLVELEPRLLDLYREAQKVPKDSLKCGNWHWYGYGPLRGDGLKRKLIDLVGWGRTNGPLTLQSCDAWDIANRKIYNELPNCGPDCLCL